MTARRACIALSVAALTAGITAHPAGAASKSVEVGDFRFTPNFVTIATGDTVNWRFIGPEFNHSVTSNPPGQAESFDSDPGKPGFPFINHPGGNYVFSHTFTKVGSFTYYCKVHPAMTGTVAVKRPGSPGTGPGGDADDRVAPVTRLAARRRQDIDRLGIRVRLDEPGTVTVTGNVKVRGRRRAFRLRRVRRTVAADERVRVRLRLRRSSRRRVKRALRRGRRATARVRITAVDAAGNRRITRRRIRLRP